MYQSKTNRNKNTKPVITITLMITRTITISITTTRVIITTITPTNIIITMLMIGGVAPEKVGKPVAAELLVRRLL